MSAISVLPSRLCGCPFRSYGTLTSANVLHNTIHEAWIPFSSFGGLGKDNVHTGPADILVSNPSGSASAAYRITVTLSLNSSIILEAGISAGAAAKADEVRKHSKNGVKST